MCIFDVVRVKFLFKLVLFFFGPFLPNLTIASVDTSKRNEPANLRVYRYGSKFFVAELIYDNYRMAQTM